MPRAALLLAIGVVFGAAGAIYIRASRSPVPSVEVRDDAPRIFSSSVPAPRVEPDANAVDALGVRPRGTAERATFYAAVARADARGVESLLIVARALSDRNVRAFALDVLLARYAELDPSEAVAAAKELDVPSSSLVPLYQAWLTSSLAAALASLGALEDPKKTEVATGLLALVSDDDALVARVIAVLPAQPRALYANALGELARMSPAEALARAGKIADAAQRRDAVNRVLSMWARSDPRAVADYLAGLDPKAQRDAARSGVWQQIAMAAPELALERAEMVPQELRGQIQGFAIQTLAQRDPKAALARFEQMPQGAVGRNGMLPMIARSYAMRDPEGALAWARAQQPPQPGVMAAVISGLADKDPAQAFDLASEIASPLEQTQALQSVVNLSVMRDPASLGPLLERVLAMPNGAQRQMLVQMALNSLASSDPDKAVEWLIANPGQAPNAVQQVASTFARTDPARAVSYSSRLTGDARVPWLRGVANAYAQVDSRGALEWVEQLRGTPEYDEMAFAVLQSATPQDLAATTRLIESIGREDYQRMGIQSLATRWTNTDPAAAANWATNLRDPAQRTAAVQAVGSTWANQNAPAAKEWVLSQPSGPVRDGILLTLMSASARFGPPDTSLLADISTDQGRVAAVQSAAMAMAQRDADGARAFVESNVTDSTERERVLSMVSQVASRRMSVPPAPYVGAMYPPGILPTMSTGVSQGVIATGVGLNSTSVQRSAPTPATAPTVRSTGRP
jgi:hypothetical protein